MPVILGFLGSFLGKFFSNVDILALAKSVARILIISGTIAFIVGFSVTVVNTLVSILNMLNGFSNDLNEAFSSGSGLSCFYWFFSELGLDIVFTSLMHSLVGLFLIWAGFTVQIFVFRWTMTAKTLLLEATK